MVFLNPWFLLGLAAAAIPVLIHLLHVKKLRTVEFSSLRFLKELQKSRIRAVRIRQLLLLLLRTLLIIALVMAFARPTVRGSFFGSFGGAMPRTTLILLDDSPSMTVRDERGVRFEQARLAAQRIAATGDEEDRVIFSPAAPLRVSVPAAAPARSALDRAINGSAPSVVHVPFAEALRRLRPALNEQPASEREIFLITDAQASQFALPAQPDGEPPDPLLHATVVQVGSGTPGNTGVVGVDLESQVLGAHKPMRLKVTLRHTGNDRQGETFVSLYLDGTRVAQRSVDLPAGLPTTVTLDPLPKRTGAIAGYVQIEDDALETDNIRHFTVRIPEQIRVMVVGESPADLEYPMLAFTLRGDSSFARMFRVTPLPRQRFVAFDGRTCDVLVLCGLRSVTAAEAAAITRFTAGGGGVILFAPPGADQASYRDILLPALGLPRTVRARVVSADSSGRDRGFVTFSSVDRDHPLLRDLLERTRRDRPSPPTVESPRVTSTFALPTAGIGQAIISLSNGETFLSEFPVGKGHLLWFSVDGGRLASDFPLRGIYAPLLHRAVLYLAGRADAEPTFLAGEPVALIPPEGLDRDPERLVVKSPSGLDEQYGPQPAGPRRKAAVKTGPAMELGIYELRSRDATARSAPVALAAVTLDTAECDLRTATDEELAHFWKAIGVAPDLTRRISADGSLEQSILETRNGTELWRFFAGLALLCALLEMYVARISRAEVPDA